MTYVNLTVVLAIAIAITDASCCELSGIGQFQCFPLGTNIFFGICSPSNMRMWEGRACRAQSPTDGYLANKVYV